MYLKVSMEQAQTLLEALQYAKEGAEQEIKELPKGDEAIEELMKARNAADALFGSVDAQMTMEAKRSRTQRYHRYQLQWMMEHGLAISDLVDELEKARKDPDAAEDLQTVFVDWEFDSGFGGQLWACENEWEECDDDMMSPDDPKVEPLMLAIEVKGGLVQNVYANGAADVEVYDLDVSSCPEEGEENELDIKEAELNKIAHDPTFHRAW